MKRNIAYALLLMPFLASCGGTRVIDTNNTRSVSNMSNVMELEFRDWERAAENMTNSMMASGAFTNAKKPVVIAIAGVTNDTMQRFDTDILVRKIRTTLIHSGKVRITTNFTGEDMTSQAVRNQRNNAEFDPSTIAGRGTLVAPSMSLSGRMMQRNFELHTCWFCARRERVEYYLQLALTDVRTGLSVWEDVNPIIKEGRNAPTW